MFHQTRPININLYCSESQKFICNKIKFDKINVTIFILTLSTYVTSEYEPTFLNTKLSVTCPRLICRILDVNNDFVEAKSTVLYHTYTEKTSSTFWLGRSSFLKHTDIWGPNSTVLVADKLQLRAEVTYYSLDPAPVDRPRILQCESALTNFEDL